MYFVTALLCLQIVLSLAAKQGDFGVITACTRNNSLRLKCKYAPCLGSPIYTCHISSSHMDPPISIKKCEWTVRNHKLHFFNRTTTFNCTLNRKGRIEKTNVTVNYSSKTRKDRIKPCPARACSMQQPVLITGLWPSVILMWIVLVKEN